MFPPVFIVPVIYSYIFDICCEVLVKLLVTNLKSFFVIFLILLLKPNIYRISKCSFRGDWLLKTDSNGYEIKNWAMEHSENL